MPAQSEADLKNSYSTYKASFEAKYPDEYLLTLNHVQNSMQSSIQKYTQNYQNLINNLISSLHTDLQHIIGNQLFNLLHQPNPSIGLSSMIFSEDQYKIFNILVNSWVKKNIQNIHIFF